MMKLNRRGFFKGLLGAGVAYVLPSIATVAADDKLETECSDAPDYSYTQEDLALGWAAHCSTEPCPDCFSFNSTGEWLFAVRQDIDAGKIDLSVLYASIAQDEQVMAMADHAAVDGRLVADLSGNERKQILWDWALKKGSWSESKCLEYPYEDGYPAA